MKKTVSCIMVVIFLCMPSMVSAACLDCKRLALLLKESKDKNVIGEIPNYGLIKLIEDAGGKVEITEDTIMVYSPEGVIAGVFPLRMSGDGPSPYGWSSETCIIVFLLCWFVYWPLCIWAAIECF